MNSIIEAFTILIGLASIAGLIVFFVMASNVGTLVQLSRARNEQNKKIIALLTKIADKDGHVNEKQV